MPSSGQALASGSRGQGRVGLFEPELWWPRRQRDLERYKRSKRPRKGLKKENTRYIFSSCSRDILLVYRAIYL
jgi:hypothetical protein